MPKEIIYTEEAPEPGNYSQAVKHEDTIYVSGQTADDPETGAAVHGTVTEQTEIILTNIKNILETAGSSMKQVLKVNIYIRYEV
jgi:2-iminobutanoate/2-iminopropanoate deaminase